MFLAEGSLTQNTRIITRKISFCLPDHKYGNFCNNRARSLLDFRNYLFFIGAEAQHSQGAAGSAAGGRGELGGGAGLGRGRYGERLTGHSVAEGVGEVLLHLLPLSLLDVILSRVFQVSLNLRRSRMIRM